MTKNYIMLGMGYVSGKHLKAIKETGGNLIAYCDIHDVVGHVDNYFIGAKYYRELLHLDCFVDRQQRSKDKIDYCVICLPNHLHNPAIRWALNHGLDVIVEKPIVLHERNLDELLEVEERTGRKVNTVLQMRLHESARKMAEVCNGKTAAVKIQYHTPRGEWFHNGSWKADPLKTGGLVSAIGIHLLDLCCATFGPWVQFEIEKNTPQYIKAWTEFERATVEWELSIESHKPAKRMFLVNGIQYDFTNGFTELHTKSYQEILDGLGFGIWDARQAIRLAEEIKNVSNN